jgi:hypothetical protein
MAIKFPDSVIAKMADVTAEAVRIPSFFVPADEKVLSNDGSHAVRKRRTKKIRRSPVDAFQDLLGKMPDQDIAAKARCSLATATRYRQRRGIPAFVLQPRPSSFAAAQRVVAALLSETSKPRRYLYNVKILRPGDVRQTDKPDRTDTYTVIAASIAQAVEIAEREMRDVHVVLSVWLQLGNNEQPIPLLE